MHDTSTSPRGATLHILIMQSRFALRMKLSSSLYLSSYWLVSVLFEASFQPTHTKMLWKVLRL